MSVKKIHSAKSPFEDKTELGVPKIEPESATKKPKEESGPKLPETKPPCMKIPPNDWSTVNLEIFTPGHNIEIENLSQGLSEQEACDYWGLDYTKLPENDKWFFDVHFKRGRTTAKRIAVDRLFKTMSLSGGKDACMAYLVRFNDDWDEGVDDKSASKTYKLLFE